jgi:tetratricopeptide (TPR) repeat protein
LADSQAGSTDSAHTQSVSALARVGLLALVLAIVLVALWPSLRGELVYDDLWLVARNPSIQSLERLPDALTQSHWDLADPEQAARVGYWRPLTSVALFIGHQLGGGAPAAFHVVSLLTHLAATAIAFLLAERLTKSTLIALWTALLFGLHPVQVESVAWISAVNDPLCGVFVLAALLAHLRWRERGSQSWPILAPTLFAFALLAKESALAWFPLALAIDAGRRIDDGEPRFRPFARAFAPAAGVFVLYWLARVAVFGDLGGGFDRVTSHLYATFARDLTLRVELFGGALGLLVAPLHLNLFREVRPDIPASDPTLWLAIAAIAVWACAIWLAWKKRSRVALAALAIMALAIAPACLRIEAIGRFPLSERFLYVSVFGVALLAASCLVRWLPRVPGMLLLAVLAVASGVKAHARTAFWQNEETVFRASAAASPRSMYVQWGLGRVLLQKFQRTGDLATLEQANSAFLAAQDLWTDTDTSVLRTRADILQANLGHAWAQLFCALHQPDECSLDEAELVFNGILKKFNDSEEAYCGLGVTLRYEGKLDEADQALRHAIQLDPKHRESWFNLGRLQLERQQWSDALASFDKCVALSPDDVEALVSLAMAAIETGATDRARQALSKARELAPEDPQALVQLGVLAAREQRFDAAREFFESALKIDGSRGDAHLLRAKALVQLGDAGKAIGAFQDAVRWLEEPSTDPQRAQQRFEARYDLGVLLVQRGQGQDALQFLESALELQPDGPYAAQLRELIEQIKSQPGDSKH